MVTTLDFAEKYGIELSETLQKYVNFIRDRAAYKYAKLLNSVAD